MVNTTLQATGFCTHETAEQLMQDVCTKLTDTGPVLVCITLVESTWKASDNSSVKQS